MDINDLNDDGFIESMQENEEGQMVIPSSNLNMEPTITKDVNYEAFHGTSNFVATQPKSTNPPGYDSFVYLFSEVTHLILFSKL